MGPLEKTRAWGKDDLYKKKLDAKISRCCNFFESDNRKVGSQFSTGHPRGTLRRACDEDNEVNFSIRVHFRGIYC
jgi:hypothetical protein